VDDAFSCYNKKVTVRQSEALGDEEFTKLGFGGRGTFTFF
jgi:hypothetical protein